MSKVTQAHTQALVEKTAERTAQKDTAGKRQCSTTTTTTIVSTGHLSFLSARTCLSTHAERSNHQWRRGQQKCSRQWGHQFNSSTHRRKVSPRRRRHHQRRRQKRTGDEMAPSSMAAATACLCSADAEYYTLRSSSRGN